MVFGLRCAKTEDEMCYTACGSMKPDLLTPPGVAVADHRMPSITPSRLNAADVIRQLSALRTTRRSRRDLCVGDGDE